MQYLNWLPTGQKVLGSHPPLEAPKAGFFEKRFSKLIMHPIGMIVRLVAHSLHTAPKLSVEAFDPTALPHHRSPL